MSIEKRTYRGIQWQRDSQGRIRWWHADGQRWIRWHPGDDAPPRPEGWDQRRPAGPPPLTRPAWRSPYRLIPIALAVVAIAAGLYQVLGTGGSGSSATEARQALAYLGKCLPKDGKSADAGYASTPVACDAPSAAGKVTEVVTWAQGKSACPANAVVAILTDTTVSHPHLECIEALPPR